jgi:pimeloyl-ACP methyl ester carboxylesterase
MKAREQLGRWSSPKAERRFRSMEDELWRTALPYSPEAFDIETSVGVTHGYRWPGGRTPIVFLHGMGGTSLQWAAWVDAFDGWARFAIDTMGDVGRSVQRVAFRDPAHIAEWLDETLAALGLGSVHLVGSSFGGWLALNQAAQRPERVVSIVLIEPVGLAPINLRRFITWGMCVLVGSMTPKPVRRRVAVWTRMPLVDNKPVMSMTFLGQRTHPFRLRAEQFSDNTLRRVTKPTLVLLGAKSEIQQSAEVAERLRASMPHANMEIVPGAGHALPVSHADLVTNRIETFLREQADASD